jgi:hypothetical protein
MEISWWSSSPPREGCKSFYAEANTTGSTATKRQPPRMGRRKLCARILPRPCRGAWFFGRRDPAVFARCAA